MACRAREQEDAGRPAPGRGRPRRGCARPVLPYARGPAEAGCAASGGYTHLGPPGTVPATGQAWEREKRKSRFVSRGRVPDRASGWAAVLSRRGDGLAPPAHAASRKAVAGLLGPAANPNTQPPRPHQDPLNPTQRPLSPRTRSRAWASGQKGHQQRVVVPRRSQGPQPPAQWGQAGTNTHCR